jgi:hypothetical protein
MEVSGECSEIGFVVFMEGNSAASRSAVVIGETDAVDIRISNSRISADNRPNFLRKGLDLDGQTEEYHCGHVFSFPSECVTYSILEMGEESHPVVFLTKHVAGAEIHVSLNQDISRNLLFRGSFVPIVSLKCSTSIRPIGWF